MRRAVAAGLGVWLLTGIVLFSEMARLHPRYVEGLVPAVTATLGIGLAWATSSSGRARLIALVVGMAALVYYGERLLYGRPGSWWIALAGALGALAFAALARVRVNPSPRSSALLAGATLALALLAIAAIPVEVDKTAIENRVSDAGYIGALPGAQQRELSTYLIAHQGSARYELAAESATGIGSLIVQDARPVVVLTTYEARVFTTVAKLEAPDRRRGRALRLPEHLLRHILDDERRLLGARALDPRARHRRLDPGGPRTSQAPVSTARSEAVSELTNGSLDTLAAGARAAGRFAFDTEFMGEGRYRTLLCLIQLAVPDADPANPERIELIDPLEQDLDGAPLAAILADPAIQVVVHAGRQDVALVRRRFATDVRNVFDTQIAAGFAGLGAQSSYDTLLAEILDVRLAKSASFTRWDTRPLSPEQSLYAREDVVHLLALAAELERRLTALGRLEWAREECRFLERRQRRARPRHGVRAPAADSRPRPLRADDRARARGVARAYGRQPPTGRCRASSATPPLVEIAKRKPVFDQAARADPWRQRGEPAPPRVRAARRRAPRRRTPTGAAAPGGPPAAAGPRGRAPDRPLRGVRTGARPRGRPRLRAARRARRPAGDRRRPARRRGGRDRGKRAHIARLAPRARRSGAAGAARRPRVAVGASGKGSVRSR